MSSRRRVVILGAGPTGLGAAYYISSNGYSVSILERANYIGGASASFKVRDYIVDYGPHAFHIKKKEITDMIKDLIKDDYVQVKRRSRLILDGKNLGYPLNLKEALFKINPILSLRIIMDYVGAQFNNFYNHNDDHRVKTFEEWGIESFGNTLYKLAFGNYSEKMWGLHGSKLSEKLGRQKFQRKTETLEVSSKFIWNRR